MDFEAESRRAQIEQFKRDRGPYVIGHVGATVFLIAIAWTTADHNSLLWFGVFHHIATWFLALTFYLPLRSKNIERLPLWTYAGTVVANASLSSALLFDLEAAGGLTFTLIVAAVLFAGAAGTFVTMGTHPNILRVSQTSLLLPFAIMTMFLGHIAVSLGILFHYCNVVVAGVWKLSSGQQELIKLRIEAAQRAELAEIDAETDHLTGLSNRRGLERLDGMELETGAATLYFDVNKFKTINDTYGHDIGDEILQVVAQRLRSSVSASDVVARLGGDEFMVVIFRDDISAIDSVVERLCERLQQPVSVSGGLVLNISAAVGRSYTNGPVLQLSELLRDSDHAMYRSKKSLEPAQLPASPIGAVVAWAPPVDSSQLS